ncbi:RagB/SusD family nutrient uptake outer membrane protein [Mucilaginibacter sp. BJC16-A38]|uniref:RagB/SusD family nutrient uptake outer membrane protein n=1 Tax=Mucilaginibacter phenanthrenivorans TaxID=1234842 RepID=UPI002157E078|nr:RagB/SusD family nutrient uptake outer membrane protein [Mucilaginibacter phenanthrenivorans]MCR8560764.1 RagB/SusD family nutrient uptake outer membrane protein [Mucilaginibacter phenanthrenivorans]
MKNSSNISIKYILVFAGWLLTLTACKKEDRFLAAKPDQQLFIPNTLTDLVNLIHNEQVFNTTDPGLGEIGTDDFFVTDAVWTGLSTTIDRNGYIWAKNVYDAGQNVSDWSLTYSQVYYANTVLDNLPLISVSKDQQTQADELKGDALFFRGKAFYTLLQTFSLPYDSKTAGSDLGIPLRLTSDLNQKSVRSSIQEGYNQAISDLQASVNLLPVTTPFKTQPSQAAANGFLSRVYLALGNYQKALDCANLALNQYSTLMDFNVLRPGAYNISSTYLPEDIFHCVLQSHSVTTISYLSITDTPLYHSYAPNDLRKSVFYRIKNGSPYFRGNYDYKYFNYSGIATDELYLNKAECQARLGNPDDAMNTLNSLMVARWAKGTFIPFTASSSDDALIQILNERRKELLYRGLRWTDLRRLNKDPRFATTLKRIINGVTYTLPPNDNRYAWPIPDNEIALTNMPQNER